MNDLFLRSCRREPVERTPVWFMRQAGRSLPEYRKIRRKYSLLEICRRPDVCCEVTLQPIRRLGVDAAIFFSDIMVPLGPMGVQFDIVEKVGPVIGNPITRTSDVRKLRIPEWPHALPEVFESIRLIRQALAGRAPLIGFAGAPFTLAAYLIENKPSRDLVRTRSFMLREPATWHALMDRLATALEGYLLAQVEAGAQAVQLFDSWAGSLSAADYDRYVLPYSRRILRGLRKTGVPRIHFGTGTAMLLERLAAAGADVVGVDWRVPLDEARRRLGRKVAVQGNLDPVCLLGPWEGVESRALDVLRRAGNHPGHVFNLGHGVLPETPVGHLQRLVELVHAGVGPRRSRASARRAPRPAVRARKRTGKS